MPAAAATRPTADHGIAHAAAEAIGQLAFRSHRHTVGDLEFAYEGVELPASAGRVLLACLTAPGSPSAERVQLLGSLAVTPAEDSPTDDAAGHRDATRRPDHPR